jgi:hypothetical protein
MWAEKQKKSLISQSTKAHAVKKVIIFMRDFRVFFSIIDLIYFTLHFDNGRMAAKTLHTLLLTKGEL